MLFIKKIAFNQSEYYYVCASKNWNIVIEHQNLPKHIIWHTKIIQFKTVYSVLL